MAGQNPITYDDLLQIVAEGHDPSLPINLRQNTFAEYDEETQRFDVFLYGTRLAILHADGSVEVNLHDWDSNTTVNRVNDLLIPLGSKMVRRLNGKLFVQDSKLTEYHPNTTFVRFHNDKDA